MKQSRGVFLAIASVAALVAVPSSNARSGQFDGKVCALVTAAAQRAAGAPAPCVQSTVKSLQLTHPTVWVANWGTSSVPGGPDHFMTVQVGPPAVAIVFRKGSRLNPIRVKYVGPVELAPGVKGYYALSGYKGTAGGRGTIRFVKGGYLCQMTVVDASTNVLPGLLAVAKSAAARL
jgi:hypothetical protein